MHLRNDARTIIGERSEPPLSVELSEFSLYLLASGASPTLIGERREPHTYRTAEKNLRHIYIYICFLYIYIYIYIYTFVRRARAVHARATRKRRTGRLRFNGQYNRLKNGYFSSKL